jgi:hypothetical protein
VTVKTIGSVGLTTSRRNQGVEAQLCRSKAASIGILDGIENRLQIFRAAISGTASTPRPRATQQATAQQATAQHPRTQHPRTQQATAQQPITAGRQRVAAKPARHRWSLRSVATIGALVVALGLGGWSTAALVRFLNSGIELTGPAAVNALVDRIISAESGNRFDAINKASSAAGAGQFIEATWLDLIRVHRPELAKIKTKAETLDLRREPKIAREMTTRFVERNAAMLRKRGLPVTASNIYLAHFAGGSGAVAILLADETADAASVMAKADSKGRITREQLIKGNPFLQNFSAGDLKRWADRKMRGPHLNLAKS